MMTTADIVVDTEGRPILVVPETLPYGDTVLTVRDDSFDIAVNGETALKLDNIEEDFLIALGLQKQIGISVQPADQAIPDTINYVADVALAFTD